MIIDYSKIKNIDTSIFKKHFNFPEYPYSVDKGHPDATHHLFREGEHYQFLVYLTMMYDDVLILDVGTSWGESAVSLSQNPKNRVISYDILKRWVGNPFSDYTNLEFKIMDINKEDENLIKSAKIIFLDIAHDGQQEWVFTDMLTRIGYQGYVVCDDIHSPNYRMMDAWWDSLRIEKYDITDGLKKYPHGMGLINYYQDGNIEFIN